LTTRSQLIAEVLTSLKKYNESGLIDMISLNLWTKNALLKFGGNIMPKVDKVLEVKNGMAKLPENFYSLFLAAKCTPDKSEVLCGEQEEDTLQNIYQYRVRTEAKKEWDNLVDDFKTGEFIEITEKLFFHDGRTQIEFKYRNPQLLKLTRGFKKDRLCGNNLNLQKNLTNSCPYEINILGDYIQTNFNTGFIYIQYQGLPTEEDTDDLIIPEVTGNYVYEYIEAELKKRIFQDLWNNGDDLDVQNKLVYWTRESADKFSNAMTAAKFEGMGGKWWKELALNHKKRNRIYQQFAFGK
jgi:hypothetical protein